jgi:hypothetical protein
MALLANHYFPVGEIDGDSIRVNNLGVHDHLSVLTVKLGPISGITRCHDRVFVPITQLVGF